MSASIEQGDHRMDGSLTGRLWTSARATYDAILAHPFLAGLTDGSLPSESFGYYLAQDAHYLRDYARTLAVVAAKAPTHVDTALLATHAAQTAEVELALHGTLLPQLGIDADDAADLAAVPVSPTTTAYTSYLLATAYGGAFAEGLAAVLPCYWIYQRVGAALVEQGSPDPRYQAWIDTYAGDDFAASVAAVLALVDRLDPDAATESAMLRHFGVTARYEWMFWDAGWRREGWPV